jgi:hypothetical protein
MKYNIYRIEFKNGIILCICSDEKIQRDIWYHNQRKKSDFEISLESRDPVGYNEYKVRLFSKSTDFEVENLCYEETLNENIEFFNQELENILFEKVGFNKANIEANYFSNLFLVKKISVNENSKGVINLEKFVNAEEINLFDWRTTKTCILNNNSNLKSLIVWYYNPKEKLLSTMLQGGNSIEYLELNSTNIETLEGIEKLKNLKKIVIHYGRNLKSVKQLNFCNNLTHVTFNNCKKIEDFDLLEKRENLVIRNTNIPG